MRIETSRQGNVVIFRPRGPLAGADADGLKAQLTKTMAEGPAEIVLDGSGILFVDSRGLEVLMEAAESIIRDGRTLKLVGLNPTLQEVLELTGLAPLFQPCQDVETAVRNCQ